MALVSCGFVFLSSVVSWYHPYCCSFQIASSGAHLYMLFHLLPRERRMCFGCEGLYNHAHAYGGNVYVCAVLEKGIKCKITLTPQAKGLSTLSSCQQTTAPSVSKPDPTANLHTPTSLTWLISMAIRSLRASAVTANYMSLTGTFFFKFFAG